VEKWGQGKGCPFRVANNTGPDSMENAAGPKIPGKKKWEPWRKGEITHPPQFNWGPVKQKRDENIGSMCPRGIPQVVPISPRLGGRER